MKKSVAAKWVKALRSGKYEQGTGVLRSPEGTFCCLGVLCDISGLSNWRSCKYGEYEELQYLDTGEVLPIQVQKWSGVQDSEGFYGTREGGIKNSLAGCNDGGISSPTGQTHTFAEIANFIEKNYKYL